MRETTTWSFQDRSGGNGELASRRRLPGHLGFAAGASDPTFLRGNVDRVFADVLLNGDLDAVPGAEPRKSCNRFCRARSPQRAGGDRAAQSSVFADDRAGLRPSRIDLVSMSCSLPAPTGFHSDLLFHQTDEGLFNCTHRSDVQVKRCCLQEVSLMSEGGPSPAAGAARTDYLEYCPLAMVLNNCQTDPFYPHGTHLPGAAVAVCARWAAVSGSCRGDVAGAGDFRMNCL